MDKKQLEKIIWGAKYTKSGDEEAVEILWRVINELQEENTALKKQLSGIKYLSYDKIRKEFNFYLKDIILWAMPEVDKEEYRKLRRKFFKAVCSLAISKERIIEVLEKDRRGKYVVGTHKQIANEILGDDKDE